MSTEWIAILSAGVGAAGAVAAQLVSSFFNRGHDRDRLEWEKAQRQSEQRAREIERTADWKLELYSRFLRITYQPIISALQHAQAEVRGDDVIHARVPKFDADFESELNDLRWQIKLVGSLAVAGRVEMVHGLMVVVMLQLGVPDMYTAERRVEVSKDALGQWQELSHAMRFDLNGDDSATEAMEKKWRQGASKGSPAPVNDE